MDRLIFTAVSGMTSAMVRQRVIASNMANAQTIGFRAETLQSSPVTIDGQSLEVRAMAQSEVRGVVTKPGAMMATGRPLDIAMQGDAMLTVQTPDGSEGYTRRGDLSISPGGVLQNGDGLPVIGEGGPVTVPLGAELTINPDGALMLTDPQTPDAPPVQIDRLKLVSTAGSTIEKDLTGVFRVPGGGALPIDENARLATATLEQSNVNTTQVLVEMVEAQRMFDMRTKLISTARELDEGSASLMRISPA
jgi:flagellar basal-body rod protein FlgF